MLSNHTVVSIEEYEVRSRYPRFIGKNSKVAAHRYGVTLNVIEITTDKGARGFGLGKKDRLTVQSLLGRRVSDVFDPAVGITDPRLFYADIALHDLAGKILGIPVKRMINPDAAECVSCYDGAIYMDDISPDRDPAGVDGLIEHCKSDMKLGYKDFKLKMGRQTWMGNEAGMARDIEVVRRVRAEFPESRILVDPNDRYTVDEAITFMEGIKDCDIYWIEEPFEENREDLTKFREYLKENSPNTLIADGEWAPDYMHTVATLGALEELVSEGLVDAVLMDTVDYGFTNWRSYLKSIAKTGRLASPHNWNSSLKTFYCSHLAAAYPDVIPTIEGVVDTIEGVDQTRFSLSGGQLKVPEAPGFGMEFIWGRQ